MSLTHQVYGPFEAMAAYFHQHHGITNSHLLNPGSCFFLGVPPTHHYDMRFFLNSLEEQHSRLQQQQQQQQHRSKKPRRELKHVLEDDSELRRTDSRTSAGKHGAISFRPHCDLSVVVTPPAANNSRAQKRKNTDRTDDHPNKWAKLGLLSPRRVLDSRDLVSSHLSGNGGGGRQDASNHPINAGDSDVRGSAGGAAVGSGNSEEATSAATTNIGHVFPELLSMIFKQLDVKSRGRAAQVCKRWRDACYEKSVWKGTEVKIHIEKKSPPTLYPSLVRRGITRVQVLSLKKSLRELLNGIPKLESLNLSGCYTLSDGALDCAFNKDLPNMKRLNLSLCKDVSDNSVARIAKNCRNLEILNLAGCAKVSNTGLNCISWGLRHIKDLDLRSCRAINDSGIQMLFMKDSYSSRSLKSLSVQDCQKLSDNALTHVTEGAKALEKINLSFCNNMSDTGLKALSDLSTLNSVNMRSCDNVSDIGIGYLSEKGSKIKSLDVSFCSNITDTGIKHMAQGMKGLNYLSVSNCFIADAGLTQIAENMKDLSHLNIAQCNSVTDQSLNVVAKKLNNLETLDLYGCSKISDKVREKVRKMPKMSGLNLQLI